MKLKNTILFTGNMTQRKIIYVDLVAEDLDELEITYVNNAVQLIEEDNSIPFIARYRRIQTGGMDAEKLRELKRSYDSVK